jgi:hypothetical protein
MSVSMCVSMCVSISVSVSVCGCVCATKRHSLHIPMLLCSLFRAAAGQAGGRQYMADTV